MLEIPKLAKKMIVIAEQSGLYDAHKRGHIHTMTHNFRTFGYSNMVASKMGMCNYFKTLLAVSSSLHDIGKFGWNDNLFREDYPLGEEEWKIIRNHPSIGGSLFEEIGLLEGKLKTDKFTLDRIAGLIKSHHRDFDGRGYGLEERFMEEELLPLVRIIRIADSFDAMTNRRLYKPNQNILNFDDAKNELLRYAGTRYCPECLDAFMKVDEKDLERVSKI